jgi:F0F1-type ATP synthase membrane subunit b/b'
VKREALAVLIGIALGLTAGFAWRSHRAEAAERRAHVADSLYQATLIREKLAQRERDAFDILRTAAQREADSVTKAADDTLSAIRARATKTTAGAAARIAAAKTVEQQRDTYKALYDETTVQRDDALRAADDQRRAVGQLQAMLVADTVELRRRDARGDMWKRVADSLALANRDLMAHRRPEFGWKVGVGGVALGAVLATVARSVVK